jgi:hypothetical protein
MADKCPCCRKFLNKCDCDKTEWCDCGYCKAHCRCRQVEKSLPDSGQRESFVSGAVRDIREGKGRYDLISPIALKRLAQHYERGAKKYSERNWEKGMPLTRILDSAERHLNQFKEGDRSEDHLAAVAWNIFAVIHIEEMVRRNQLPKEFNDLPNFLGT